MSTHHRSFLEGWHLPAEADAPTRDVFRKTLYEGLCAVVMLGLVETNAAAAMVGLNATAMQLALLGSAPLLLSALAQLATPYSASFVPRRKHFVIGGIILQGAMIALASVSGFIGKKGSPLGANLFLAFFALYAMSGGMGSGVWASWMADIVPQDVRGRFFALRNRLVGVVQIIAGLSSGLIVTTISGGRPLWGAFAAMFVMAGFTRFGSAWFLSRVHEPHQTVRPPARDFTYVEFLRKTPTSNFARFVLFVALIHGTTAISGPFFAPYFLKDLHLREQYWLYAVINNAGLIGTLVFLPFWGRMADRHGNRIVLMFSAIGIALTPLPYLFVHSAPLLWLAGFLGGVAWSGFGLSSFNYVFEAVTPPRRIRCFSYLGATTGFAVFVLGMCGGLLVPHLPVLPHCISKYQTIFAISAAMRIAVVLSFISVIREVRTVVEPADALDIFFEMPGIRPARDITSNLFRALRRM